MQPVACNNSCIKLLFRRQWL